MSHSLCLVCTEFFGESRQFSGAGPSHRSGAGREDELDESCRGDVEDELAPQFDDNPRTRGSKFSVLQRKIHPIFGQMWLLTAGPLIGLTVLFAELSM